MLPVARYNFFSSFLKIQCSIRATKNDLFVSSRKEYSPCGGRKDSVLACSENEWELLSEK